MRGHAHLKIGVVILLGCAAVVGVVVVVSCGTAPLPFVVRGPGTLGNDPPTLTILNPVANLTRGQGDQFLIEWKDSDGDDNAKISFSLLPTQPGLPEELLVAGIDENDLIGPDSVKVETAFVPPGTYNLAGTIFDGVNPPVQEFALLAGSTTGQRVVVTIVRPGEGPQTVPPQVLITAPVFSQSVTQDDVLTISIQPTAAVPDPNNPIPFDPDSNLALFVLLDVDQNPNNDDPRSPSPLSVIQLLPEQFVAAGAFDVQTFNITIDLRSIPPRPGGEPYFIRVTVDDATNPPVHSYAPGTISVVRLAAGTVDLFDIGRTQSGARFQGFNPTAHLGSSLSNVDDFDADGVDDFVLVARFGNPQNVGPVGEAYLVYGQNGTRFGGTIPVNSVSETVSGAVFQAPPIRSFQIPPRTDIGATARTDGITDVSFIDDLSGDGRPELLFGLPHVHGAWDSMDWDPGDDDASTADFPEFFCYPDNLVNDRTTSFDPDFTFYAGGMGVMVNSSNRDNDGRIVVAGAVDRLDTTAVGLEFGGQRTAALDSNGLSATGNILVRADNFSALDIGTDPQETLRVAGARFIAGGYDFEVQAQPPRNGLFGQMVRAMGDLNADGFDEIIISAPRNERYLRDLATQFGPAASQVESTAFSGSIVVLPGANYNQTTFRETNDENGTSVVPNRNGSGSCSAQPPFGRVLTFPNESLQIFAEDIDDMLGGGQSAGDVNQDGLDDLLMGAPLNDRNNAVPDTGATYIIYGRSVFGDIDLSAVVDDPQRRPPMLRIRGLTRGDQIGWRQAAGLDVNGDRIDDVFIASPRTDFGGVTRTCPVLGTDVTQSTFSGCVTKPVVVSGVQSPPVQLFSDDTCSQFDYDNDGDVDVDDCCVFSCLSSIPADDVCGDLLADANRTSCVFGRGGDCCEDVVDNGFVGVVFGGVMIEGDRTIGQLATSQLPGVIFFGTTAGDRAGEDISSAGDFNQDGFGDILIAAPGETRTDSAGRERLGVVYLVFGGTHLTRDGSLGQRNGVWNLKDVGTPALPGIVFLSPYVKGRPNEAAPTTVGFLGDINNDGFGDIAIGNPLADFIDPTFPQGPDAPGSDPATGRRSDVGDVYIIYGNNFGSNRAIP